MVREQLKPFITSFTSKGDFLAILSPSGIVKIWNTSIGSLLAEWKQLDGGSDVRFSCMACSFIGKKRRKEQGTLLVALGTEDGDVLAINVFTSETKWKCTGRHLGGIAGISFSNEGRKLCAVGSNGMASEIISETGELIKEFKVSKKSISSSVCSSDEKILAAASAGIRIFSLDTEKELLKFSIGLGLVQYISISDDANVVTSGFGEKHLQVWRCELSTGGVSSGPVLSMRHPPLTIECKNGCNGEDDLVVLSVSESGVAYIWNLKTFSEEDAIPTKITVKSNKAETDSHSSGKSRKSRSSIIAARLHTLGTDGQLTTLIVYGSIDSPQFELVDIANPGEDIVITARDEAVKTVQENGVHAGKAVHDTELEAVTGSVRKERASKKRAASDPDSANLNTETLIDKGHVELMDGIQIDDDLNEPTMGEKLSSLKLADNNEEEKKVLSSRTNPPSADSVNVLLKQALRADDRALLLDCLYRQEEKVVANSVSLLNPSDVLKLLEALISMIQSRGAVLACALPWLRSLLLQHASGIMSQESSLLALNSLYQLIESRISTFDAALQLSSCLDLNYAGTVDDDDVDENGSIQPVIFEDKDESEEEGSEDAMETDEDAEELEAFSNGSDGEEGSSGMSD